MNERQRRTANLMNWQIKQLRMLADWQIRGMGLCPETVTAICLEMDGAKHGLNTEVKR